MTTSSTTQQTTSSTRTRRDSSLFAADAAFARFFSTVSGVVDVADAGYVHEYAADDQIPRTPAITTTIATMTATVSSVRRVNTSAITAKMPTTRAVHERAYERMNVSVNKQHESGIATIRHSSD